jgi:DNA-binding transcriptional LysR family regulator
MDDKDFVLLKTLYKEKNITHTAKRLFISQPAISDRLKRLEAEFGCQLFIRQPRGIVFTPQGEVLMRFIDQTNDGYRRVKNMISSPVGETFGSLTIACSEFVTRYELPQLLSGFTKENPGVEVSVRSGIGSTCYGDFLKGKFDVCIIHSDFNWAEEKRKIWSSNLCLFSKDPIPLDKLPQTPCIHCISNTALRSLTDNWWYSKFREKPRTRIETASMDSAIKMIQEGLGFSLLPEICAKEVPDLCVTPIQTVKGEPVSYDAWMYYRSQYQLNKGMQLFIEYVDEYLKK